MSGDLSDKAAKYVNMRDRFPAPMMSISSSATHPRPTTCLAGTPAPGFATLMPRPPTTPPRWNDHGTGGTQGHKQRYSLNDLALNASQNGPTVRAIAYYAIGIALGRLKGAQCANHRASSKGEHLGAKGLDKRQRCASCSFIYRPTERPMTGTKRWYYSHIDRLRRTATARLKADRAEVREVAAVRGEDRTILVQALLSSTEAPGLSSVGAVQAFLGHEMICLETLGYQDSAVGRDHPIGISEGYRQGRYLDSLMAVSCVASSTDEGWPLSETVAAIVSAGDP